MHSKLSRLRIVAVAALALAALLPVPAVSAESGTTAGQPGDLVSARQIDAPGFLYAKVWQIEYVSTNTHDEPMTVSGTVIVPKAPYPGARPIVGYAPGTHGLGDQCAPSRHLEAGDDFEGALMHEYAISGVAVAVTDYEGLGTPGDHRYMVGRSAGHALLDIVRAAQRLPEADLPDDGPVGLAGYSQGGHGASWAGQLAPSYASELKVKGVAAGGTPANLRQVADANEGKPNFGLVLAAGVGMDAAYPELDLESYLNEAGQTGIEELRNSCDFSAFANKTIGDFTTSNPLETPQWQSTLDAQNVGALAPAAPVLLYHSRQDEIIPYAGATTLKSQWCGKGVNVKFTTYALLGHAETAAVASPLVTKWMNDRLHGVPTGGNC